MYMLTSTQLKLIRIAIKYYIILNNAIGGIIWYPSNSFQNSLIIMLHLHNTDMAHVLYLPFVST